MQFQENSTEEEQTNEGHACDPKDLVDVPQYSECDNQTKAVMDDYIAQIDVEKIETISFYGSEELKRLSDVANQLRQKAEADEVFLDTFEEVQESMSSIDVGGLTQKASEAGAKGINWAKKNPGTALATAAGTVVLGPVAWAVPWAKNKLDHLKAKREGRDIANQLRENIQKTDEVFTHLVDSRKDIIQTVRDLDTLGQSRLESYKIVSVLIGAALEKLRRVDEEEIPALQKEIQDNPGNHGLAYRLENMGLGRDTLDSQVTSLVAGRAVSQATVVLLTSAKRAFQQAANKVNMHLTVSKPQWDAQAAEAGIMLAAQKVTDVVTDADEHGNQMLENASHMGRHISALMNESAKKGTFDPARVTQVMHHVQATLQNDVKQLENHREDMSKARALIAKEETRFSENVAKFQARAQERLALQGPASEQDNKLNVSDGVINQPVTPKAS